MVIVAMMTPTFPVLSTELKHPVEIRDVQWGDDLSTALARSKASGKPVLVLLQEAPSCVGCQTFDHEVFRHPLLVEAIEDEFVPVVINHQRQPEQSLARRVRHPESVPNGLVLRFLDATRQDLIPSMARVWTTHGIASRMIEALLTAKRRVPTYLRVVAMEQNTLKHQRAAFAMFCFWTGEYELGKFDGVISTEAGWLEGREVTLVLYLEDRLSLRDLAKQAAEVKCARKVFVATEQERHMLSTATRLNVGTLDHRYRTARASDQKKQLQRWNLAGVPNLTPMQLTKLNAFGPDDRQQALQWLSPRQRKAFLNP